MEFYDNSTNTKIPGYASGDVIIAIDILSAFRFKTYEIIKIVNHFKSQQENRSVRIVIFSESVQEQFIYTSISEDKLCNILDNASDENTKMSDLLVLEKWIAANHLQVDFCYVISDGYFSKDIDEKELLFPTKIITKSPLSGFEQVVPNLFLSIV